MKSSEKLVLSKIKNADTSKLHFVEIDFYDDVPSEDQGSVEFDVNILKNCSSLEDRLLKILDMAQDYATFDINNRFQCREGANRSTIDILRIYNNYFRPVNIFTIMRALYKLVESNDVGTLFCNNIKKQVFIAGFDNEIESILCENELGVRLAEWRTIGL